jgi:HlyD family secretion protein
VAGGAFFINKKNQPPSYETVQVERRNLEQSISITGKVVASEEIDLAFEKGGRVANVSVKVGDLIEKGTVLASLSTADAQASVAEARANVSAAEAGLSRYQAALSSAKADLAKLETGSREEEKTLARSKVTKAQQSLTDAETSLSNVQATAELDLANLYNGVSNLFGAALNHAENAVQQQADQFFDKPYGRAELNFTTVDTFSQNNAEANMELSEDAVVSLKTLAQKNFASQAEIDIAINQALSNLVTVNNLLYDLSSTLNAANNLSTATASEYASDIATARTNINADISALTTRKQAIASQKITNSKNIDEAKASVSLAKENLNIAKDELEITLAGPTVEQLTSARAEVQQAEANLSVQQAEVSRTYATLQRQYAELSKTSLIAPFKGIVTDVAVTVGEIIGANQIAVSLISDGEFEIETNVPEADIANVKIGDVARFTLDAFENVDSFTASVAAIDPAETFTDGVATYEVKLVLDAENTTVKPGMTADISIITDSKNNVLTIPFRAINSLGDEKMVEVLEPSGTVRSVSVVTGLRDREGNIEIISGLSENDQVILGIKNQ